VGDEEVKQFNVYLPVSLIKRVKLHAVEHGSSLSALVTEALRTYLGDTHEQPRSSSTKET
jgi:predicted HicB family RNase H-like nuclease